MAKIRGLVRTRTVIHRNLRVITVASDRSDQPHCPHAGMALGADDDMVVDGDLQYPSGLDDLTRQLDVLAARLRIAAGMVVDKDDRGGVVIERALDHLANIDRRLVDDPSDKARFGSACLALR